MTLTPCTLWFILQLRCQKQVISGILKGAGKFRCLVLVILNIVWKIVKVIPINVTLRHPVSDGWGKIRISTLSLGRKESLKIDFNMTHVCIHIFCCENLGSLTSKNVISFIHFNVLKTLEPSSLKALTTWLKRQILNEFCTFTR